MWKWVVLSVRKSMGKTTPMNMEHMIDGKHYIFTMSGKCVTDMQILSEVGLEQIRIRYQLLLIILTRKCVIRVVSVAVGQADKVPPVARHDGGCSFFLQSESMKRNI